HVADLVAEHSGDLREVRRPFEQTAIHIDEAARHREGVHVRAVDDVELPVEIPGVGDAGNRIAEYVHVAIQLRILYEGELSVQLGAVAGAQLDFLLGRDGTAGERGHEGEGSERTHWFVDPSEGPEAPQGEGAAGTVRGRRAAHRRGPARLAVATARLPRERPTRTHAARC